ncbi:MAG: DNA polymerase sliding clamp [Desulfurococcaceae archaeon]
MTLHIVYPEGKFFKEIIDCLSKMIDEVAFQVYPDKLLVRAMDPGRVSLIEIEIPSSLFLEYVVDKESNINLSVANLSRILKGIKKGSRFVIEQEGEDVIVKIEALGKRVYKFRNLDIPLPEIPELTYEFDVRGQLMADTIKHAIKDAESVGDQLEIAAPDDKTIVFRGKGTTLVENKLTMGSPSLIYLEVRKPSKSTYQLEFLRNILGLTRVADVVTIEFSNDSPLKLAFKISEGEVRFLLAPAIT